LIVLCLLTMVVSAVASLTVALPDIVRWTGAFVNDLPSALLVAAGVLFAAAVMSRPHERDRGGRDERSPRAGPVNERRRQQ
jgi:hypothetical protein